MFSNHFTTNLSQNAAVKKIWKSVSNWLRYWQNLWLTFLGHPVYILTEMLGYLLLGPRQLLYIAGGWRGPAYWGGFWGGAVTLSQKILGLFTWNGSFSCKFSCILTEMLGKLLLGSQQLHVYMYCWRMREGRGWIEPVDSPSLRAWCMKAPSDEIYDKPTLGT